MQHQKVEVIRQTKPKSARCLPSCLSGGDQTEESARPQKMVMLYLVPLRSEIVPRNNVQSVIDIF